MSKTNSVLIKNDDCRGFSRQHKNMNTQNTPYTPALGQREHPASNPDGNHEAPILNKGETMIIKENNYRGTCHKCGQFREQDYMKLVDLGDHRIEWECVECPERPMYEPAIVIGGFGALFLFGAMFSLCWLYTADEIWTAVWGLI